MSAIFISFSSLDKNAAEEMHHRLKDQGYRSVFFASDPDDGIAAGTDWETGLHRNLKDCRALIILCSEHSIESKWCFAEVVLAKSEGKTIFPVKLADCEIPQLLASRQTVDLSKNKEEGYERLWKGLRKVAFDPNSSFEWNSDRPPYPGLKGFEEEDAAIYYGREKDIDLLQDTLCKKTQRSDAGEPRLIVVVGASGCGKSSFVRAGVIPRLKKNPDRWLVVKPFRPGEANPLRELAATLTMALNPSGLQEWETAIREDIFYCDGKEDSLNKAVSTCVKLLEYLANSVDREVTVVLVIDQLEEILVTPNPEPPKIFRNLLRLILKESRRVLVLATMRSDFIELWQNSERSPPRIYEFFELQLLPHLSQVITGPAARSGIKVEPRLIWQVEEDVKSPDALPLLAVALQEMYQECKLSGEFKADFYEKELKGIGGSVKRLVDRIIAKHQVAAADMEGLRSAVLKMARTSDDGKLTRQRVRWSDLPNNAQPVLEDFLKDRLLVSQTGLDGQREVEIAHEALFRVWDAAKNWLDQNKDFLAWRFRLRVAIEGRLILRGIDLVKAKQFRRTEWASLLPREKEFINRSIWWQWARRSLVAIPIFGLLLGVRAYEKDQEMQAWGKFLEWNGRVKMNTDLGGYEVFLPSSVNPFEAGRYLRQIRNRKALNITPDQDNPSRLDGLSSVVDMFPAMTINLAGVIALKSIPDLQSLTNLKSLNIRDTEITNLDGLDRLTALTNLDVGVTELKGPIKVGTLTNLIDLDISARGITELVGVENLKSLKRLSASSTELTSFYPKIPLTALEELDLSNCGKLGSVGYEQLPSLTNLKLDGTAVTNWAGVLAISNLTNVTYTKGKFPDELRPRFKSQNINLEPKN